MSALEAATVATSTGAYAISSISAAGRTPVASPIRALGELVTRACWGAYGRGIGLIALKMRGWASRSIAVLRILWWVLAVLHVSNR